MNNWRPHKINKSINYTDTLILEIKGRFEICIFKFREFWSWNVSYRSQKCTNSWAHYSSRWSKSVKSQCLLPYSNPSRRSLLLLEPTLDVSRSCGGWIHMVSSCGCCTLRVFLVADDVGWMLFCVSASIWKYAWGPQPLDRTWTIKTRVKKMLSTDKTHRDFQYWIESKQELALAARMGREISKFIGIY